MKKIIQISFIIILVLVACKKTKFAPEGPTDVRVRNLSDLIFEQVIVSTSDETEDVDTLGTIQQGDVSDYFRFTKAFPKAEITATIQVDGSPEVFTTGPVDYTYMNYIGQDRITYEVYISSMNNKELTINNVILEEPLVLK